MYKVILLTKFRADMPREEVLAWWRGPHAALAKATPGMIRYVQSYWTSALDDDTWDRVCGWALWKAVITHDAACRAGLDPDAAPRRAGWRVSALEVVESVLAT